jgi:hypothetical protein
MVVSLDVRSIMPRDAVAQGLAAIRDSNGIG